MGSWTNRAKNEPIMVQMKRQRQTSRWETRTFQHARLGLEAGNYQFYSVRAMDIFQLQQ
jgi:hypothetical protein